MARITFSNNQLSLEFIWEWYEVQRASLRNYKQSLIKILISSANLPISYQKFEGFNLSDIDSYFIESEKELEFLVSFNLISSTEALLKIDFFKRVFDKDKSAIGRKFRDIYKEKQNLISIENDIIDTWKIEKGNLKKYFSNYLGILKFRHWLAHGRYWNPKLGRKKYDARDSYQICKKIFEIPELLK